MKKRCVDNEQRHIIFTCDDLIPFDNGLAIEVTNLRKVYGDLVAVNDISFAPYTIRLAIFNTKCLSIVNSHLLIYSCK